MLNLLNKPKQLALTISISLLLVIVCYCYYGYSKTHPGTDNAYVQANTIYIASQVSGPVIALNVANYQKVTRGSLLFEIDPRPYQLALDKAMANLHLAEQGIAANQAALATANAVVRQRQAELDLIHKNTQRFLTLVKNGQMAKASGDEAYGRLEIAKAALSAAQHQYEQSRQQLGETGAHNAQLQAAQAALHQAELDLAHTHITAPATGLIVNLNARTGSMITSGQPLFVLIEDNVWWVEANFKETELQRIHQGQAATIGIDIYPHKKFQGVVTAISSGSGAAFSILPPENATGNWVKVTQRFPVRILIKNTDPRYPLRVGASCDVTIDANSTYPGIRG